MEEQLFNAAFIYGPMALILAVIMLAVWKWAPPIAMWAKNNLEQQLEVQKTIVQVLERNSIALDNSTEVIKQNNEYMASSNQLMTSVHEKIETLYQAVIPLSQKKKPLPKRKAA